MDRYLQSLLALPSNSEGKEVVYAGYIEAKEQEKRGKDGIPLHPEVVEWYQKTSEELNIDRLI